MNNKLVRKEIILMTIYKTFDDIIRYSFGLLLILFNFSLQKATFGVFKKEIDEGSTGFWFMLILNHTRAPPIYLAKILTVALIVFSLLELFFLIGLLLRRKWGAIGFFCIQFVWVPIDLLIVSKFILLSNIITILIELVIISFMIRLIISPKGYFKK